MLWSTIGITAACLTMFGYLPQIIKIYRTKSAKDISLITVIQFSAGVFLWALYGIHIKDIIVIVANTVSLTTFLTTLVLYFKYK